VKRRLLAVVGLLTLAAALVVAPPEPTTAAWTLPQQASGTFKAGTVMPPTSLTCTAGVGQDVVFKWVVPAGDLATTGYRWTLTPTSPGGPNDFGSIEDPAETSHTLSGKLLALGSARFSLYAVGPSDWEAVPVSGQATFTTALFIPVITSCSVP
jgi:hypothetical protein